MTSKQIRQEWQTDPSTFLSIKETLPHLPVKRSAAAVYSWATRGRLLRNGKRVYLESIRGFGVCTTLAALQRFFEKVQTEGVR